MNIDSINKAIQVVEQAAINQNKNPSLHNSQEFAKARHYLIQIMMNGGE